MPSRQTAARGDKANLRTRLAELRSASGARQHDMAEALGLSLNTYRKLEAGGYNGEEPIGMLVNAAMVLGVDPMLLIEPHLQWHTFRLDRTNAPAPGTVHPGVPAAPPVPGSVQVDEALAVSTPERELLRSLIRLDDHFGGAVFSWKPDGESTDLFVIDAVPAAGRKSGQRRADPVYAAVTVVEGAVERGLLVPQAFGLSLAARQYAERLQR